MDGGQFWAKDVAFTRNTARVKGGAIYVYEGSGIVVLEDALLEGNRFDSSK